MSYFLQRITLIILAFALVIGVQTSCSSSYLIKKVIFAEEENKELGESENSESSNLHLLASSEIKIILSSHLFQHLNQNEEIISPYNALVLTSPPNV